MQSTFMPKSVVYSGRPVQICTGRRHFMRGSAESQFHMHYDYVRLQVPASHLTGGCVFDWRRSAVMLRRSKGEPVSNSYILPSYLPTANFRYPTGVLLRRTQIWKAVDPIQFKTQVQTPGRLEGVTLGSSFEPDSYFAKDSKSHLKSRNALFFGGKLPAPPGCGHALRGHHGLRIPEAAGESLPKARLFRQWIL